MRASPALFNRFRAEHVNPSIEATEHPRKVQDLSSTIVAMVSTVRVPGRGMASTRNGRAEVGQLRLSVAVTTPLGPSLLRRHGGWRRRSPLTASTNHGAGKQITPAQQRFDVTDFESSSKSWHFFGVGAAAGGVKLTRREKRRKKREEREEREEREKEREEREKEEREREKREERETLTNACLMSSH